MSQKEAQNTTILSTLWATRISIEFIVIIGLPALLLTYIAQKLRAVYGLGWWSIWVSLMIAALISFPILKIRITHFVAQWVKMFNEKTENTEK